MNRKILDKQVGRIQISASPQYFVDRTADPEKDIPADPEKGICRYLEVLQGNYTLVQGKSYPTVDDAKKAMRKIDLAVEYIEESLLECSENVGKLLGEARRNLGSYVLNKQSETFLNPANKKIGNAIEVLRDSVE